MSGDQLQPEDTLDDRGVEDVLDEGYSPPERETVTELGRPRRAARIWPAEPTAATIGGAADPAAPQGRRLMAPWQPQAYPAQGSRHVAPRQRLVSADLGSGALGRLDGAWLQPRRIRSVRAPPTSTVEHLVAPAWRRPLLRRGLARRRGALRRSWVLFATTMGMWADGRHDLVRRTAAATGEHPLISVGDWLYLLGIVPAAARTRALPGRHLGAGRARGGLVLDVLVLGSALLLVGELVVLDEVVGRPSASTGTRSSTRSTRSPTCCSPGSPCCSCSAAAGGRVST